MLLSIVKSQENFRRGAIASYPNHHIFSEVGRTFANGTVLPPRPDMNGKMTTLKKGKAACNCPSPPGDFPIFKDGSADKLFTSVPWKICLKCPHHINSVRPHGHFCAELKRIRAAAPSGIEEAANAYGNAVKMASDMMG